MMYIRIIYYVKKEHICIVDTNIKKEIIRDVLCEWILEQIGSGVGEKKYIKRDAYEILITCELTKDTFRTKSDTGNNSLTTGIVLRLINQLGD